MKKRALRTTLKLAILLLVVIIVSCSNKPNATLNNSIDNYPFIPRGAGISFGIVTDDQTRTVDERTFPIKHKDKLNLNIMIANTNSNDMDIMLIPIIDYTQKEVRINNSKQSNFLFNLKSNKASIVPIEIDKLGKGIHDVIFLIVKDPNNFDIDEEYRKKTELSHIVSVRLSVVVDEEIQPSVQYSEGATLDNTALQGIFLSKDNNLNRWLIEDVDNKKNLEYTIQVGNNGKDVFPYAVIAMKDWKQVKFNNSNVIYGTVSPNKRNVYTNVVNVTDTKKVSNFTAILIPKPFEKVDRFKSMSIEPSVRLGIIKGKD